MVKLPLVANGMSPADARSVIQDEIDMLGRDALPTPGSSIWPGGVIPDE